MPGIEEFDQLFTPSFISKRKREGERRKEGESESEVLDSVVTDRDKTLPTLSLT